MAAKTAPSAATNSLLPDQAPLWRIKGGSAILQVDDDGQRVRLKSGTWQSWDSLQRSAQYDLARYGHVQTLDGGKIACDWALNDAAVRALVEQQPWKPPGHAAGGFTARLRGALGLAGADGDRPKSTSAPKTPLPLSGFFRGRRAGDRLGPTPQRQEQRRSVSWADERPGDHEVANVCGQDTPKRWSHGADAAGVGPAALERIQQSTAADATMEDARLNRAALPKKQAWTPAFCTMQVAAARARTATGWPPQDDTGVWIPPASHPQQSVENGTLAKAQDAGTPSMEDWGWTPALCVHRVDAARVREETGRAAQVDDGVLPTLPPHPQPAAANETPATAYDAGKAPFENLEWTPALDDQHAADVHVRPATESPSHVADVLEGPTALAPRPQTTLVNATRADAPDVATIPDCPPGMTAVFFDRGEHDEVLWRPVVVVDFETARETVRSSEVEGLIPVFTGTEIRWVDPDELEALSVTPEAWSRLRSHFEASPPPTPSQTPGDQHWAWLTPAGLGAAVSRAFALPRHAVPHVVGRGGSLIRQIESILGLIVGVVDGGEGGSTVTVFGPEERVDWARPVIECVARGGRSILRHLEKLPFD